MYQCNIDNPFLDPRDEFERSTQHVRYAPLQHVSFIKCFCVPFSWYEQRIVIVKAETSLHSAAFFALDKLLNSLVNFLGKVFKDVSFGVFYLPVTKIVDSQHWLILR